MCEYKFRDGKRCEEEALPNSDYCILHVDLPEEEESKEFKRINELKEEKVKEKVNKGDLNFEGARLFEVNFSGMKIEGGVNFIDTIIRRDASFVDATIKGKASFVGATIKGKASFDRAIIKGNVSFKGATIKRKASFEEARMRNIWFYKAIIERNASFKEVRIERNVSFYRAKIEGKASFEGATIKRKVSFSLSNINSLTFKNAKFNNMSGQEEACRTARKTQERIGDRVLADYHFYREMEAKRKQKYKKFSLKPILKLIRKFRLEKLVGKHIKSLEKERRIYWGFLELPVQYIFGYGVHPRNVIATWLLTVIALAFVYWIGNGVLVGNELEVAKSFWDCLYFSVVTAATPGYGGYKPAPGLYQGLATIEAIFGIFMWAAFIATFARKYMR